VLEELMWTMFCNGNGCAARCPDCRGARLRLQRRSAQTPTCMHHAVHLCMHACVRRPPGPHDDRRVSV
jgi:hypothetical protein